MCLPNESLPPQLLHLRHIHDGVATLQHTQVCPQMRDYCMNQPWLTTIDWPVSAVLDAPAK